MYVCAFCAKRFTMTEYKLHYLMIQNSTRNNKNERFIKNNFFARVGFKEFVTFTKTLYAQPSMKLL